jgi:hypothetical protein
LIPKETIPMTDPTLLDQLARQISDGAVVAVDPDDATDMAAFEDDALDLDAALDSRFDAIAEDGE